MKRTCSCVPPVLAVLALCACSGCMTVAKQAIAEVRGARGELRLIEDARTGPLGAVGAVAFTPATTSLSHRIVPSVMLRAYDEAAGRVERELKGRAEGPALTVDSDLLYFQRKGVLSGAQLLTRVRFRLDERVALDGLVVTESDSFREGGERALAEATMKAIREYLDRRIGGRAADDRAR